MKRILSPGLVVSGVLALAIYFAVAGGDHSVVEARRAEAQLSAGQAEIRRVQHEIDSIRARIDSLRHHDEALERFAREFYGFIRDGEYLYRISEPQSSDQPEAEPSRPSIIGWLRGGDGASGSR